MGVIHRIRWPLAAAALIAVIAIGLLLATHATSAQPQPLEGQIEAIALTASAKAGDSQPTSVQYATGTRVRANQVDSGDIVPGNNRSYLVAIRGHFTLNDVSIPSGASAPSGTVLTLVLDAKTLQITDLGVSDRYPQLAKLGPVTTTDRQHYAVALSATVASAPSGAGKTIPTIGPTN